jgi:hypothetical protein
LDGVVQPAGTWGGTGSGATRTDSRFTGTGIINAATGGSTIVLTCSSNITVAATGPSGAAVFYTSSATGTCPPVNVNCNPPSGSTFPIGTNTVTCLGSDACGGTTNCSFTVTVTPLPGPQPPDFFFAQPLLPPVGSVYISPAQWHVLFNNGIAIRDVRHRFFTQNYPLPPLGVSQTETFSSELDFDLSTDNGATFTPASGTANVTVQVTHSQDVGGTEFFDTEMLQLDLTGSAFMLRESPTLQSTGQTTVRPVAGGYMVSSFFDIFTEVSLDGGISWTPAQQAGHVEMHPDPKEVTPVPEPTPFLPPPNGNYVSPAQCHALFAEGIVIKDVRHKLFTQAFQPPPPGITNLETFNSQIDLQISLDGGNTFQYVRVAAPVTVTVASHGSSSDTIYDTEMTSLSLSGLPAGVMIRESAILPSRGEIEITAQADGTFQVSSFFDIFTELSLDGGATWSGATNGPVRMELTTPAPEVPKSSPNLPPLDGSYVSPAQWLALYANGIIISNVSHDRFTQTQPPPPPGGNQTESFGSQVSGLISFNGGASFQSFSAPANVAVQVNSRSDEDTGSTRFFDTEMLSLDLSGGNLPAGVMVRESPSKASLGRTSIRTDGSGYQISSFFDIFTEVSLDGGQTWSPSVTMPGTMGLATNPSSPPITISCPSNITVQATSPSGAVVFFTVTASGGCSPPPGIVANPPSGSTFPVGTTTVFATASDTCGSSTNCSFTVTVYPPVTIGCPSNITVQATGPSGSTVFFTVDASGGCSPPPFVTANPPSGSTFPVGTTMVLATASDTCGNSTNCSFTVTVYPPVTIGCPSNITVQATGPSGSTVFFSVDASGGCSPPPFVTANPPSGSTFPIGTTMVTCTASDTCGTSTNCSFTVTVNPASIVLNCSSNITVTAAPCSNSAVVFFTSSASGGCSPPPFVSCNPPSGSSFPLGTTMVTCTASDACGNSTNCSFNVIVNPYVCPPLSLTCSSNITLTAAPCSNSAVVFYSSSASGGCPPANVFCNPPSGSSFPLGTTMVTCTASDSCGNSTNCSFNVTVNPYVCPPLVLNCSSNITVTAGSCANSNATVFFSSSVSGGCAPVNLICNPPSGSSFPLGTTMVTCTASDSCGNSTNCSFNVTVNPYVCPPLVLNCSSNITVTTASCGSSNATVFFSSSVSGGCAPVNLICNPPSGSSFALGATTVTCTASDSCGNSTNCSFVVTVKPYICPITILNPRIVDGVPTFTVQSQIGLRYLLQYKDELADSTWTTVSMTSGNGQQLDLIDCCPPPGPSRPHRFYRVEIQEDDSQ